MNIKYLTVITILFLCCIFGFEEFSYSLNKVSQDDISELNHSLRSKAFKVFG